MIYLIFVAAALWISHLRQTNADLRQDGKTLSRHYEAAVSNMESYRMKADKYDALLSILEPGGAVYGDGKAEAAVTHLVEFANKLQYFLAVDGITERYAAMRKALQELPFTAGLAEYRN